MIPSDVDPAAARTSWSGPRLLLCVATALALALTMPFVGCIEQKELECAGGIFVGDECFPLCEPDECLEGNICVDHQCRLVCHSHRDCDFPRQECRPPSTDRIVSGDPALVDRAKLFGVCTDVGRFPLPSTFGTPCPIGDECWATGCPNGLECDLNACLDGNGIPHPEQCIPDPVACNGAEPCNIGTCGEKGPPCIVTTCPYDECTPFTCLSAGNGDADAYCTHHDCQDDDDCPGGWYCGVTRDPHDICGPTCQGGSCSDDGSPCTLDPDCQKGNSGLCGTTDEPCIPPDQFAAAGKTLFEGSACLLRRTCLKRQPCVGCESNLDCSHDPQMVCLDLGGELTCARFCGTAEDCFGDEDCVPSYATCEVTSTLGCGEPMLDSPACPNLPCAGGFCRLADGTAGGPCTTSAECPRQACVWRNICMPRSGACRGAGGFCDHCVDDTDCGVSQPAGRWACDEVGDGEFACFDFDFPDACPSGADSECPQSPSGAHGECLDSNEGVEPGDSVYHRCYFPMQGDSFTCWP